MVTVSISVQEVFEAHFVVSVCLLDAVHITVCEAQKPVVTHVFSSFFFPTFEFFARLRRDNEW